MEGENCATRECRADQADDRNDRGNPLVVKNVRVSKQCNQAENEKHLVDSPPARVDEQ